MEVWDRVARMTTRPDASTGWAATVLGASVGRVGSSLCSRGSCRRTRTGSPQWAAAVGGRHSYGWTLAEVAELLGIGIPTVQKHTERGMEHLRRELGVEV